MRGTTKGVWWLAALALGTVGVALAVMGGDDLVLVAAVVVIVLGIAVPAYVLTYRHVRRDRDRAHQRRRLSD